MINKRNWRVITSIDERVSALEMTVNKLADSITKLDAIISNYNTN